MDPTEHNEIENKELKEHLGNAALQMLAEGTDYKTLDGTCCQFGYLFLIDGHGLEALLRWRLTWALHTSLPRGTGSSVCPSMRRSLRTSLRPFWNSMPDSESHRRQLLTRAVCFSIPRPMTEGTH